MAKYPNHLRIYRQAASSCSRPGRLVVGVPGTGTVNVPTCSFFVSDAAMFAKCPTQFFGRPNALLRFWRNQKFNSRPTPTIRGAFFRSIGRIKHPFPPVQRSIHGRRRVMRPTTTPISCPLSILILKNPLLPPLLSARRPTDLLPCPIGNSNLC